MKSCKDCRFFVGNVCTHRDFLMEWAVQGDGAADACRNYSPFEFGYCMVCGKHSKNLHENGGFIVELGNGMSLDVCSADCKAKVEAQQAINAAIAIMSNEAKS